jgi:N6-adenosine-specific RNA methylase IME4
MDQAVKAERREVLHQRLRGGVQPWPAKAHQYAVIYADPPWRFEPWSRKTGMDRAADNHYPTMTVEEIVDLDVPGIASKDAVLFLWATVPMLQQALAVMNGWGFQYRSHVVWDKSTAGTGYWFRNRHELLLVGVTGKPKAPKPGTQWPSVVCGPRSKHSEKPDNFRRLIRGYFPTATRIELFARGQAPKGWDAWGQEAER